MGNKIDTEVRQENPDSNCLLYEVIIYNWRLGPKGKEILGAIVGHMSLSVIQALRVVSVEVHEFPELSTYCKAKGPRELSG